MEAGRLEYGEAVPGRFRSGEMDPLEQRDNIKFGKRFGKSAKEMSQLLRTVCSLPRMKGRLEAVEVLVNYRMFRNVADMCSC